MTKLVVDVKGICKSFGQKRVVDGMDLQIKSGEVFGFLGPNGSGKTTMMRILCGLMRADIGSGTCMGYDLVTESERIKSNVGYMPQHFSYYRELSVFENLKFIATLYGHQDIDTLVMNQATRFGLKPWIHEKAGVLSGGWKQRLSLAAAMLNNPKLLLLDEPTAGVDPDARRYFWSEIHQIAQQGVTVFVSTHFMDEAIRCDRLVYMLYGKKVAEGSQDELIKKSGISVYEVRENYQGAYSILKSQFPKTSMSIMSGGLRLVVSSGDDAVSQWVEDSPFMFEPVKPTIEEVFIYYSSGQNV